MNITERFLKYVSFDTQSAEDAGTTPSTAKQLDLARYLRDELTELGLTEVELDENGYLYATLPANTARNVPTVGFIAHMDTSPDCSGADVKPRIVKGYDGGDITLDAAAGIVTSPAKFPELLDHVGEDIIVTDGHTLLGADDKAGIAEIVQAMAYLLAHPEIEHGKVRVGFNPDEEIGLGAHKFDVAKFGCDWGYTMDGGEVGELEFENFNAAAAKVEVTGVSVHPGYAKGKMVNAARVASEFAAALPAGATPEETEGYEGFFHLTGMEGCAPCAPPALSPACGPSAAAPTVPSSRSRACPAPTSLPAGSTSTVRTSFCPCRRWKRPWPPSSRLCASQQPAPSDTGAAPPASPAHAAGAVHVEGGICRFFIRPPRAHPSSSVACSSFHPSFPTWPSSS